jgi:hypothetical protein
LRAPVNARDGSDRGSVLMLMPAAVLIVLLLGSIAFDLSLVYLRQRQATDLAIAAANDAAIAGIDQDLFRATQEVVLDDALVDEAASAAIAASDLQSAVLDWEATAISDTEVEVTMTVRVDYLFAAIIPGANDGTTVTARVVAVAEPG